MTQSSNLNLKRRYRKTANGLKNIDLKTTFLLKIHKEGNPGRPVVSSIDCCIFNNSKYVYHHLQPIVKEIPSYVKASNGILDKLDTLDNIQNDSLLVTMDVKSFYMSIQDAKGMPAVEKAYDSCRKI